MGKLIEFDRSTVIFEKPKRKETEDYITGRVRMSQSADPKLTRTSFQKGLDDLKDSLIEMSRKAEEAVELAVDGYRSRDPNKCQAVFELERQTNEDERAIDEIAIDLLAMQQPVAVDLRFITACMKINADLERVGDQAVNIAQRALNAITLPVTSLPIDVERMGTTVGGMIRRALDAFVSGDADLADAVRAWMTSWTASTSTATRPWFAR